MRAWLNITWAKLAAFFLTLLFGLATILGSIGIAILAYNNVFLDKGESLRQGLYQEQCYNAIDTANSFLCGQLDSVGLMDHSYYYPDDMDTITVATVAYDPEAAQRLLDDLPRLFAEEFPPESSACQLNVFDPDSGEVWFSNFNLTGGEKILYTTQNTYTYHLVDSGAYPFNDPITVSATLLEKDYQAPSYSYLFCSWLLEHTGLTVFLTVLFAVLTLFCFCFLMASCGHWQGRDGIHLTWLDRIPADVWLIVLLCLFCMGWEAFYYEWGRIFFCAALTPLLLLFLCVFSAQCKAGTVLRGTLIARFIRLVWRIMKATGRGLYRIAKGLPLMWKTALVTLALVFIEFILFIQDYYGTRAAPFLLLKLLELLAILYIALSLRTLQKGGEAMADGDFSQNIDTRLLIGDFKRYGQRMNDLRSGIEQAVQEQTKAERMKTELITNVSHDIKTPLTSIVNYVDLLQKEDVQSEAAREYIAVLDRQSRRLKKLTEDLVEASKASSGALPVDLQPTDVSVLFDQIVGEYQERLADCRLTLVARPPEQPLTVCADGKLLSRVMDNLMSNICKYALEDTRVYAVASCDEKTVTISLKNVSRAELNISPDELMERFVRGDASRHTEGSGLGLSIAGSLVQLMGGTFDLSIDGDLFRADITLPRA